MTQLIRDLNVESLKVLSEIYETQDSFKSRNLTLEIQNKMNKLSQRINRGNSQVKRVIYFLQFFRVVILLIKI